MGGVGTSILGRPRPLPGHRRAADDYTLNCEEPPYAPTREPGGCRLAQRQKCLPVDQASWFHGHVVLARPRAMLSCLLCNVSVAAHDGRLPLRVLALLHSPGVVELDVIDG